MKNIVRLLTFFILITLVILPVMGCTGSSETHWITITNTVIDRTTVTEQVPGDATTVTQTVTQPGPATTQTITVTSTRTVTQPVSQTVTQTVTATTTATVTVTAQAPTTTTPTTTTPTITPDDNGTGIPGDTLADLQLQNDVLTILIAIGVPYNCTEYEVINSVVIEYPNADGLWVEHWTLDSCGEITTYEIRFAPDGMGGTFFGIFRV